MKRNILSEAALVALISLVLALAGYILHPGALPLTGGAAVPAAVHEEWHLYKKISFELARKLFEERKALFADARPLIAYEAGHIQGAVQLDPHALDLWADRLIASYPSDQPIITYCEGPRCALSEELAEKLTWLGFEEVFYLVDGWGVWQAHQMPVDGIESLKKPVESLKTVPLKPFIPGPNVG